MTMDEHKVETQDRLTAMLSSALGSEVEALLRDATVSEVRVNEDGKVWVMRLGEGKALAGVTIPPDRVLAAIYTVAYSIDAVCDTEHPCISAELPGSGARFQAVHPPIVRNPILAIRKKAVRIFTLRDLEAQGVISADQRGIIEATARTRGNILVVGGTDSGKTTFTNAILDSISSTKDRIIIMEDTQELQCSAEDVVYLRTKEGVASLRDLVRATMRLSPDRIVIGEVRGGEALELLKAWNTGHGGGVSTVHASSAAKGLSRIEQLALEGGASSCRQLISEAINLVIYMEKVGTKRVVKEIASLHGFSGDQYDIRAVT